MRTAEEWVNERTWASEEGQLRVIEMVKRIQLDALREAAEIARTAAHRLGGHQFTHDAILARIKEVEG